METHYGTFNTRWPKPSFKRYDRAWDLPLRTRYNLYQDEKFLFVVERDEGTILRVKKPGCTSYSFEDPRYGIYSAGGNWSTPYRFSGEDPDSQETWFGHFFHAEEVCNRGSYYHYYPVFKCSAVGRPEEYPVTLTSEVDIDGVTLLLHAWVHAWEAKQLPQELNIFPENCRGKFVEIPG